MRLVNWVAAVLTLLSFNTQGQCKLDPTLSKLTNPQLLKDIAELSSNPMQGRKTGTAGHKQAQQFLKQRFSQIGLKAFLDFYQFSHSFPYPKSSSNKFGMNIVGWVAGQQFPEQIIVVTAHYDHLGKKGSRIYFGADDNASGVAAMLFLATEVLKRKGLAHSVVFVATDAEEKGLYGAKALVQALLAAKVQVKLNLNLDMLAQGGRRNRLYATHSRNQQTLAELIKQVASQAPLCLINGHRKSQNIGRSNDRINWRMASDHGAFLKADLPFIFIGVGVHNQYHTVRDNFENIDQDFFVAAASTAWQVLQAVDALEED
ncbi:M20/M25/M40 family metallo-hydrolase [Paraglaciecola aestuariivivens]